jgi:hypothetical protein
MTSTTVQQARHATRRYAAQTTNAYVRAELERHGVGARPRRPVRVRLWLPVSLLWVLFPLVLLASPVALAWRASPARFIAAVAALLAGLSGALVEVETPDADIYIRLF